MRTNNMSCRNLSNQRNKSILLIIAENQHSFSWLAEAKLLQVKLALIQMKIDEAKQLLAEAL